MPRLVLVHVQIMSRDMCQSYMFFTVACNIGCENIYENAVWLQKCLIRLVKFNSKLNRYLSFNHLFKQAESKLIAYIYV